MFDKLVYFDPHVCTLLCGAGQDCCVLAEKCYRPVCTAVWGRGGMMVRVSCML